jgi:hypothetical protein
LESHSGPVARRHNSRSGYPADGSNAPLQSTVGRVRGEVTAGDDGSVSDSALSFSLTEDRKRHSTVAGLKGTASGVGSGNCGLMTTGGKSSSTSHLPAVGKMTVIHVWWFVCSVKGVSKLINSL